MARIIVLGAGMVGRAIAIDLASTHDVTSADISEAALRELGDTREIMTTVLDIRDPKGALMIASKTIVTTTERGWRKLTRDEVKNELRMAFTEWEGGSAPRCLDTFSATLRGFL